MKNKLNLVLFCMFISFNFTQFCMMRPTSNLLTKIKTSSFTSVLVGLMKSDDLAHVKTIKVWSHTPFAEEDLTILDRIAWAGNTKVALLITQKAFAQQKESLKQIAKKDEKNKWQHGVMVRVMPEGSISTYDDWQVYHKKDGSFSSIKFNGGCSLLKAYIVYKNDRAAHLAKTIMLSADLSDNEVTTSVDSQDFKRAVQQFDEYFKKSSNPFLN